MVYRQPRVSVAGPTPTPTRTPHFSTERIPMGSDHHRVGSLDGGPYRRIRQPWTKPTPNSIVQQRHAVLADLFKNVSTPHSEPGYSSDVTKLDIAPEDMGRTIFKLYGTPLKHRSNKDSGSGQIPAAYRKLFKAKGVRATLDNVMTFSHDVSIAANLIEVMHQTGVHASPTTSRQGADRRQQLAAANWPKSGPKTRGPVNRRMQWSQSKEPALRGAPQRKLPDRAPPPQPPRPDSRHTPYRVRRMAVAAAAASPDQSCTSSCSLDPVKHVHPVRQRGPTQSSSSRQSSTVSNYHQKLRSVSKSSSSRHSSAVSYSHQKLRSVSKSSSSRHSSAVSDSPQKLRSPSKSSSSRKETSMSDYHQQLQGPSKSSSSRKDTAMSDSHQQLRSASKSSSSRKDTAMSDSLQKLRSPFESSSCKVNATRYSHQMLCSPSKSSSRKGTAMSVSLQRLRSPFQSSSCKVYAPRYSHQLLHSPSKSSSSRRGSGMRYSHPKQRSASVMLSCIRQLTVQSDTNQKQLSASKSSSSGSLKVSSMSDSYLTPHALSHSFTHVPSFCLEKPEIPQTPERSLSTSFYQGRRFSLAPDIHPNQQNYPPRSFSPRISIVPESHQECSLTPKICSPRVFEGLVDHVLEDDDNRELGKAGLDQNQMQSLSSRSVAGPDMILATGSSNNLPVSPRKSRYTPRIIQPDVDPMTSHSGSVPQQPHEDDQELRKACLNLNRIQGLSSRPVAGHDIIQPDVGHITSQSGSTPQQPDHGQELRKACLNLSPTQGLSGQPVAGRDISLASRSTNDWPWKDRSTSEGGGHSARSSRSLSFQLPGGHMASRPGPAHEDSPVPPRKGTSEGQGPSQQRTSLAAGVVPHLTNIAKHVSEDMLKRLHPGLLSVWHYLLDPLMLLQIISPGEVPLETPRTTTPWLDVAEGLQLPFSQCQVPSNAYDSKPLVTILGRCTNKETAAFTRDYVRRKRSEALLKRASWLRKKWKNAYRTLGLALTVCRTMMQRSCSLDTETTYVDIGDEASKEVRNDFQFDRFRRKKEVSISSEMVETLTIEPEKRTLIQLERTIREMQKVPVFCNYPVEIQEAVARRAFYLAIGPKRIIMRRGHEPMYYYIIICGQAYSKEPNVNEATGETVMTVAQFLKTGDTFGSEDLIQRRLHHATVISRTWMQLLAINGEDYLQQFWYPSLKSDLRPHLAYLSKMNFMKDFPITLLQDNLSVCTLHHFRRNTVIVSDSLKSKNLYIVKLGYCKVFRKLQRVDDHDESCQRSACLRYTKSRSHPHKRSDMMERPVALRPVDATFVERESPFVKYTDMTSPMGNPVRFPVISVPSGVHNDPMDVSVSRQKFLPLMLLREGEIFGLDQTPLCPHRDKSRSVILVSLGAEIIALRKDFYCKKTHEETHYEAQKAFIYDDTFINRRLRSGVNRDVHMNAVLDHYFTRVSMAL